MRLFFLTTPKNIRRGTGLNQLAPWIVSSDECQPRQGLLGSYKLESSKMQYPTTKKADPTTNKADPPTYKADPKKCIALS